MRTVTGTALQDGRMHAPGAIDDAVSASPWNQRALIDGVGFSVASRPRTFGPITRKRSWDDRAVGRHSPQCRARLVAAMLEASQLAGCDRRENRRQAAKSSPRQNMSAPDVKVILARLLGRYEDGPDAPGTTSSGPVLTRGG